MFLHDIVFTYMVIGGERDIGSGSIMEEPVFIVLLS